MEFANIIVNQIALLIFSVLLLAGALSDVRNRTIPNRFTAAIALLYPVHVMASFAPVDWMMAIAISSLILLIGAAMFARGFMGGGDAKMLAAGVLWAGPELALPFLIYTALVGGLLSIMILVRANYGWVVCLAEFDTTPTVPYGVAIAGAGLLVAYTLFLS